MRSESAEREKEKEKKEQQHKLAERAQLPVGNYKQ